MSAEWKPGDIASVNGQVCMRLENGWEHGDPRAFRFADHETLEVRPLVVIDPEDAEQVTALANAWDDLSDKHASLGEVPMTLSALRMQAALREFANPTPPKPEEPQGLGAVVEDADGKRWIRTVLPADEEDVYRKPWSDGPVRRNWQIVDAVHVLSEGVTL